MSDGLNRLIFCFFIVSVVMSGALITNVITADYSNPPVVLIDSDFKTVFTTAPFIETGDVKILSPLDLINENRLSRCRDVSFTPLSQMTSIPSLSSCLNSYRTSELFIPLQ